MRLGLRYAGSNAGNSPIVGAPLYEEDFWHRARTVRPLLNIQRLCLGLYVGLRSELPKVPSSDSHQNTKDQQRFTSACLDT